MTKILITGANSYIGISFEKFCAKYYPTEYEIDTVDMLNDNWKNKDFFGYDCVFHVAGIVHIKQKKSNEELFYRVNTKLAIETARKAKASNVKQFIYLSSMSVYGLVQGSIDSETIPKPETAYGKSKLEAENGLWKLKSDDFKVCIVRPPIIYGFGCKGNYQLLRKCSLKLMFFPEIHNRRSMLFIDNLSSVIKELINGQESGIFFPQNKDYICTSEMVKLICASHNKMMKMTGCFNPLIRLLMHKISVIQKVFGSLVYDKSMNVPDQWLVERDTFNSIKKSEGVY